MKPTALRSHRRAVVGVALAVALVWLSYSVFQSTRRTEIEIRWAEFASVRGISTAYQYTEIVPWTNRLGRVGQYFAARALVFNVETDQDAQTMLGMPECPAPFRVAIAPTVSLKSQAALRDRFGDLVQ